MKERETLKKARHQANIKIQKQPLKIR